MKPSKVLWCVQDESNGSQSLQINLIHSGDYCLFIPKPELVELHAITHATYLTAADMHWEFEVMLLQTSLAKVITRGRRVWSAFPSRSFIGYSNLLLPSLFMLHNIVHALLSCTYRSTALCGEVSGLPLVEHMCLFLCLSPHSLHSLSVHFSGCHIMSLSLTGHVTTCRLGLVQLSAEGRVTSGERSELRLQETGSVCGFLTRTHTEKAISWNISMWDPAAVPAVLIEARVWMCIIT